MDLIAIFCIFCVSCVGTVYFVSIYQKKSLDCWIEEMKLTDVFKRKVIRLEYKQYEKRLALSEGLSEGFYFIKFELSDKLPSHADMVKSGKPLELETYFNKDEIKYLTK